MEHPNGVLLDEWYEWWSFSEWLDDPQMSAMVKTRTEWYQYLARIQPYTTTYFIITNKHLIPQIMGMSNHGRYHGAGFLIPEMAISKESFRSAPEDDAKIAAVLLRYFCKQEICHAVSGTPHKPSPCISMLYQALHQVVWTYDSAWLCRSLVFQKSLKRPRFGTSTRGTGRRNPWPTSAGNSASQESCHQWHPRRGLPSHNLGHQV